MNMDKPALLPTLAFLCFLLLPMLLLSCGDPMADEIASYHAAMDPLMRQNTRLANKYLALAKAIHKEKSDSDQIVERIETEIIPLANQLKESMANIQTSSQQLTGLHQKAVAAWSNQAQAYRDLVAAYHGNDLESFNKAHGKVGEAKVMAEAYVREINNLMEPYGYHLDEFPPEQ